MVCGRSNLRQMCLAMYVGNALFDNFGHPFPNLYIKKVKFTAPLKNDVYYAVYFLNEQFETKFHVKII